MSTPDFINVNVTAPGAIVALGLLYLQTDDKTQVKKPLTPLITVDDVTRLLQSVELC
jgi:hypothetical protein